MQPADPANPYADYDAAKPKQFLATYELPRDPDAAYEYSNLSFGLLGFALAQSEHVSYAAMVGDAIFKPLGTSMSGLAPTDAMRAHLARGHDDDGKPVKNWEFDPLAGAGAIRSTANDMLCYLRANMSLDRSPLTEAMGSRKSLVATWTGTCASGSPGCKGARLAQWRYWRLSQLSRL